MALISECRACGLDVMIYCTLRALDEQAFLYRQGRDVGGRILTYAKPGESLHNPDKNGHAWAFDAVPVLAGRPLWDDLWELELMGLCGQQVGLVWGGAWVGPLRDRVHFQGVKSADA